MHFGKNLRRLQFLIRISWSWYNTLVYKLKAHITNQSSRWRFRYWYLSNYWHCCLSGILDVGCQLVATQLYGSPNLS